MPFDGNEYYSSAVIFPYSYHPEAPCAATAMNTALRTGYMICRMNIPICQHTFWGTWKRLDTSSYEIGSSSNIDLLRIGLEIPDHVTHIVYSGHASIRAIDNGTFTFQLEVDDGTNQDTEGANTVGYTATPFGSAPDTFNTLDYVNNPNIIYDYPSTHDISGEVELSNVSAPDIVEIALYGKTSDATDYMRMSGILSMWWEVRG